MMKKYFSLTFIMLMFSSIFILTGCDFESSSDYDVARKNMEQLVKSLDSKDVDAIQGLFAPNIVSEIDNFGESIEELFSYYERDFIVFSGSGLVVDNDVHNGRITKYHDMSRDVTTTADIYIELLLDGI